MSGEPASQLSRLGSVLVRLLRSAAAGGVATLVDLGTLTVLVSLARVSPRVANVPALIAGGVTMFVTQRYAFRARGNPTLGEILRFAAVQVGSLALTGFLFDLVLRLEPRAASVYVVVRLVTSNVVWLGFSFPLWHVVFRRSINEAPAPSPPANR